MLTLGRGGVCVRSGWKGIEPSFQLSSSCPLLEANFPRKNLRIKLVFTERSFIDGLVEQWCMSCVPV